jgi:LacI family transcriptional regulator
MPPGRPTIADVAREAGVSVAQAGRALGGYGQVSDATRARVVAAAAVLGYRPNTIARSMITGRTQTIGVVGADTQNPFFASALRGISSTAHRAGFQTIITSSDESVTTEQAAVAVLLEKQVDGLIVAPADVGRTDHLADVVAKGVPLVLLDRAVSAVPVDAVVIDNVAAAERAVAHLIGLGHVRIALVGEMRQSSTDPHWSELDDRPDVPAGRYSPVTYRLLGYLRAHRASGISVDPALIRRIDEADRALVARETAAVLGLADPPSALFTVDNLTTLGAVDGIQRAGYEMPGRLSMIGFDDLEWATVLRPPLSVVSQPAAEMGAAAAQRLLARIDGTSPDEGNIVFDTEMILRGSTAEPSRRARAAFRM